MFITTVIKISTVLKVIFFIVLVVVIIRYIKNIKTSVVGSNIFYCSCSSNYKIYKKYKNICCRK